MYKYFYDLVMWLMQLWIVVSAPFSEKIRLRRKGEKRVWSTLAQASRSEKYIWIHAASFGEFEQGCPVIEAIKKEQPEAKILLTFFSSSGYEACKNYPNVDLVCYMPIDTRCNVKRFLQSIAIEKVIFIKYEFWRNFLCALHKAKIPVYLVSGIFRPQQAFFKWYGAPYRKMLNYFTHFFVQNEASQQLLQRIGLENVTVAHDTRFDRVVSIASAAKQLPLVKAFADSAQVLVAGSTWERDEDIVIRYFNETPSLKLVIAPHEIRPSRIEYICNRLQRKFVKYSEATEQNIAQADCLIIDCFGLLSSIYQYGQMAYIGGGFGVGIHNTLEAAVWKIPVIFGPKYQKFQEAHDLIQLGGAFSIRCYDEFCTCVRQMQQNVEAGAVAGRYVASHAGATELIYKHIFTK